VKLIPNYVNNEGYNVFKEGLSGYIELIVSGLHYHDLIHIQSSWFRETLLCQCYGSDGVYFIYIAHIIDQGASQIVE